MLTHLNLTKIRISWVIELFELRRIVLIDYFRVNLNYKYNIKSSIYNTKKFLTNLQIGISINVY